MVRTHCANVKNGKVDKEDNRLETTGRQVSENAGAYESINSSLLIVKHYTETYKTVCPVDKLANNCFVSHLIILFNPVF